MSAAIGLHAMGDHPRVSAAYSPTDWHDLYVATASATAALTGLLFVAVSLNIERILKFEGLPERAMQTLVMLLTPLIVSILGLIPGQTKRRSGSSCSHSAWHRRSQSRRLSAAPSREAGATGTRRSIS